MVYLETISALAIPAALIGYVVYAFGHPFGPSKEK